MKPNNYHKMFNDKEQFPKQNFQKPEKEQSNDFEPVVEESNFEINDTTGITEKPIKVSTGVVTDCYLLYVRSEPSINGSVITEIPALTKVQVEVENSTDDFYKVITEFGTEGFCMKRFIAISE